MDRTCNSPLSLFCSTAWWSQGMLQVWPSSFSVAFSISWLPMVYFPSCSRATSKVMCNASVFSLLPSITSMLLKPSWKTKLSFADGSFLRTLATSLIDFSELSSIAALSQLLEVSLPLVTFATCVIFHWVLYAPISWSEFFQSEFCSWCCFTRMKQRPVMHFVLWRMNISFIFCCFFQLHPWKLSLIFWDGMTSRRSYYSKRICSWILHLPLPKAGKFPWAFPFWTMTDTTESFICNHLMEFTATGSYLHALLLESYKQDAGLDGWSVLPSRALYILVKEWGMHGSFILVIVLTVCCFLK